MENFEFHRLGQTGLEVGRLGVAGGYGAPTEAFEEAFEHGCNYFYWGSMRRKGMRQAIINICAKGKRDNLVLLIQSYSRSAYFMEVFFEQALKALRLDYADILLLGWYNHKPSQRLINKALDMKAKGLFRFLGISGHNRHLLYQLAAENLFDLFHIRYNAAHRGAETEIFAKLDGSTRPGIVTYTATRWGQLLNSKKMPAGETALSASDCYRFVLSNPCIDVCMCGPKNIMQMREALQSLAAGPLDEKEMQRVKSIGDYVHRHSKKFF